MDKVAKELARLNGMPSKVLYTDEEMEELDEQEAQSNQMSQMLQAAPIAASAARDMAQAQALAGAAPGGVAPDIFQTGG
jgi:hypothetical protein